ncbi:MAG: ATP-binding cassette domain-containing protein [Anaerolineae bacterium]|nr:ATP-binding cassette domain-containing protein [Anaerolineae bacterium]
MRVELKHIHKRFGAVHANNDVSLLVEAGTIHGLLGENGAGKSTLVKMLTGFYSRDSGDILLDGKSVAVRTPIDGVRSGVGMLHQDPLDFPALTVLENFQTRSRFTPASGSSAQDLAKLAQQFNFKLDPNELVSNLTVGERQQLELLRLLSLGVRTLILDEPTTGISASQKTQLFNAMRTLASQGKSVIFVSHKLEDVEEVCNHATVMRRGQVMGSVPVRKGDRYLSGQLVDLMFGRELALPNKPATARPEIGLHMKNVLLKSDNLSVKIDDLKIHRGEVIGLAGLEGSGQRPLILACAGVEPPVSGEVFINNSNLTHKPYQRYLDNGVCYVPADRLREGLVAGLTIQDHVAIRNPASGMFLDNNAMNAKAKAAIAHFNIRGTPASKVERLSGGNQQRTQIALMPNALNLILMEHPTRGLDIESTLWIWKQLIERCQQGTTILFASADLDEIMEYSDRVIVFSGGNASAPIPANELNASKLGEMIGGKF